MKANKYIIALASVLTLTTTSCSNWLDQEPMSNVTTGSYFTTASDFTSGANYLYSQLYGWAGTFTGNEMYLITCDMGSDLNPGQQEDVSGTAGVPTSDTYYTKAYKCLRNVNNLLEQSNKYTGTESIANSVGTAYFFRAWWHFFLLRRFGGIPLALSVPTTTSDVVWGPRNSRYEVVESILSDLEKAQSMVSATKASTSNNGSLTLEAVCAFKARVCLYEGTWEKYNGRGTDDATNGDGTTSGAGTAMPTGYPSATELLTMAKTESAKFVSGGTYASEYSIWMEYEDNAISDYQNKSSFYLFNLEGAESNPNGATKASNNEAIFRKCYDYATQNYGNMNLTHSRPCKGTRKLMDMFLCTDGLPVNISPLFKGYDGFDSEFQNRDARMTSLFEQTGHYYWSSNNGFGKPANYSIAPSVNNTNGCSVPSLLTYDVVGYNGHKFTEEASRPDYQESADYLHIRLPEMLLTYAEAIYELDGKISDSDLNNTINVIRKRAHIANLTNALVTNNGLDMKEEIRRERALELFGEGFRVSDLCRWGIAEKELDRPTCTFYVSYNGTPTKLATENNPANPSKKIYNAAVWADKGYVTTTDEDQSTYTAGMPKVKAGALITETANNRIFAKKNYLHPMPSDELSMNSQLKQNPKW